MTITGPQTPSGRVHGHTVSHGRSKRTEVPDRFGEPCEPDKQQLLDHDLAGALGATRAVRFFR